MSKQILNAIVSIGLFDRFKQSPPSSPAPEKVVFYSLYLDVGFKKELLMEYTEMDTESFGYFIRFINDKEEFPKKVAPLKEKYDLDEILIKDLIILDIIGGVYKITYIDGKFLTQKIGYIPNGFHEEVRQNFLNSPTDYSELVDEIDVEKIKDEIKFKKSSPNNSSSNTTSNSSRPPAGGNFRNLSLEDSGSDYTLKGYYTVTVPITQLAVLVGVSNETTGNNIHSVLINKFLQAKQGSTERLSIPIAKAVNRFKYLVLIVVPDSDDGLSFETSNRYKMAEIVFVPIEDIKR
jgi:hypothetical protein